MPTIQGSTSVALSAVNDNILADSQYEFLPFDALVQILLNGDANGGDLRVDVYSGTDVLMENAPMSTQNRIPVVPDDGVLEDVAAAGSRLKIRVRNTSAAAARTIFFKVILTPL